MDPRILDEGQFCWLQMPAERGIFSRPIRKDEGWFLNCAVLYGGQQALEQSFKSF